MILEENIQLDELDVSTDEGYPVMFEGVKVFNHVVEDGEASDEYFWANLDWRVYHSEVVIKTVEEQGYRMNKFGRYIPWYVVSYLLQLQEVDETERGDVVYGEQIIKLEDFDPEKLIATEEDDHTRT